MNDKRSKTHSRGSDRSRSRTDWDYLDRVTDAEIEAATKKHRDPAILVPVGFGQPDEWAIS